MRKIQPASVKADFVAQLANLEAFYSKGMSMFSTDSDKSTFVESCLLVMAVAWEGFVSDLFVAYINGDAARFKQHLRDAFDHHLQGSGKPLQVFREFGSVVLPNHLTKKQVQLFADNEGSNITFSDFAKLEEKASVWLTPVSVARFTDLTVQQKAVVNSLIALRNHIAHRSQRSLDAMNEKTGAGALHITGLRRGDNNFHNVGAWLKSVPVGQQHTRFLLFLNQLRAIEAAI